MVVQVGMGLAQRSAVALGVVVALLLFGAAALVVLPTRTPTVPPAPAGGRAATAHATAPAKPRAPRRAARRTEDQRRNALAASASVPEPPPGLGRILGIVRSHTSKDADPVEGCHVEALHPTGESAASTMTDRAGVFDLPSVPHDVPLVLRFSRDGFVTGFCCDVRTRARGALEKNVVLAAAPRLVVRVEPETYESSWNDLDVELVRDGRVVSTARLDARNEAVLRPPEFGPWIVRVAPRNMAAPPSHALVLVPTDEDTEVEFVLSPGGEVEVTALTPNRAPIAGARVALLRDDLPAGEVRTTDASGRAVFRRLQPGVRHEVEVSTDAGAKGVGAFVPERARHVQRVEVMVMPPGRVEGVVRDGEGGVLAGVSVRFSNGPPANDLEVRSSEDGRFAALLTPGRWHLRARAENFLAFEAPLDRPTVVTSAKLTLVDVPMEPLPRGAIFGSVRDPTGQPIVNAAVVVLPANLRARTDEQGVYRIERVPAGVDVWVVARRAGGLPARAPLREPQVRLVAGAVAQVDLVLRRADTDTETVLGTERADVVGRVLDPEKRPVRGALVTAGRVMARTVDTGHFRLDRVPFPSPDDVEADPTVVHVTPGPGLLLPLTFVDVRPMDGTCDLGTVALRARPAALIHLAETAQKGDEEPPSPAFWFASAHADELLGTPLPPRTAAARVTYDGTWLHLPPESAAHARGLGAVYVGTPAPFGIDCGEAPWTPAPDTWAVLRPRLDRPRFSLPRGAYGLGSREAVRLTQISTPLRATPIRGRDAGGEPVDPFRDVVGRRVYTVAPKDKIPRDGFAAGTWRIEVVPSRKSEVPATTYLWTTERGKLEELR